MKQRKKKRNKIPRKSYANHPPYLGAFAFLLVAFGVFQVWDIVANDKDLGASVWNGFVQNDSSSTEALETQKGESEPVALNDSKNTTEDLIDPAAFQAPVIEADAAIVMDAKTGKVLYEKNAQSQLPLASVTKVMTALAAKENFDENGRVSITESAFATEGESGMRVGEQWNFQALLDYGLVVSSNDAMTAISEAVAAKEFKNNALVEDMNQKATELGLSQTYFLNSSGLDTNTSISGGYGSAGDMATLFQYILEQYPDLLEATTEPTVTTQTVSGRVLNGDNTNKIVSQVPGVLASKTGFTDLAGGNLVMAWNAGLARPIIIAVLHSSYEGRFNDMQKLVDATIKSFGRANRGNEQATTTATTTTNSF